MSQADSLGTTTIDEIQFEIFPLDPWIANEVLTKLLGVLGPTIGGAVGAVVGGADVKGVVNSLANKKLDPAMLASAIAGFFDRADAQTTRAIMEQLATTTTVIGHGRLSEKFQLVFLGKPGAMYHWAAWAISKQFNSLFKTIPAAIALFDRQAAAPEA